MQKASLPAGRWLGIVHAPTKRCPAIGPRFLFIHQHRIIWWLKCCCCCCFGFGNWIFSIIFSLGITGNVLVILTILQNSRMRTVTNMFLLNLAISDLLLGVFCMPFTLIGQLLRDFIFGEVFCKLISFFQGKLLSTCSPIYSTKTVVGWRQWVCTERDETVGLVYPIYISVGSREGEKYFHLTVSRRPTIPCIDANTTIHHGPLHRSTDTSIGSRVV